MLVIGWGSTYGAIAAGVQRVRARGHKVAQAHLVHLNPFPADLGDVLARYKRVLVPEVNLGQLSRLLRAEYLVDAVSFTQVSGHPVPGRRHGVRHPAADRRAGRRRARSRPTERGPTDDRRDRGACPSR